MFNLFGRKVKGLLVIAICLVSFQLQAQFTQKGNTNFFDFQAKPYYFGITLGINSAKFTPFRSDDFIGSDSIDVVESAGGPGFNLGIVTNLKIGDYLDFRFLPTLSFVERRIEYEKARRFGNASTRSVNQILVETPFHIRYKSAPFNDIRWFVIAGAKYTFDVASEARAKEAESIVKISPTDFAVEYGAGLQFFFRYFIFSPEIKVSHGIGNTLIFNQTLEESNVLEKLLSRTFTISFHFEG